MNRSNLCTMMVMTLAVVLAGSGGCERQTPTGADPSLADSTSGVPMTVRLRPQPNMLADQTAISAQYVQAAEATKAAAAEAAKPAAPAVVEKPAEPETPQDPLAATAMQVLEYLRAGQAVEVHKLMDATGKKAIEPSNLTQAWNIFAMSQGSFIAAKPPVVGEMKTGTTPVLIECQFEKGLLDLTVLFTPSGEIRRVSMEKVDPNKPKPEEKPKKTRASTRNTRNVTGDKDDAKATPTGSGPADAPAAEPKVETGQPTDASRSSTIDTLRTIRDRVGPTGAPGGP